MDMKKTLRYVQLALVLLALLFIWGNSMLPAAVSSTESGYVEQLLRPLLLPVQEALARLDVVVTLSQLVRKLAHFTEYLVLGVLMGLLFLRADGRSRFWLTEGLCLAAALIDESIQIFSAGRGPGLRDVAIDFSGATVGALLLLLAVALVRQYRDSRSPT
jgi:VanZ family protein